MSRIKERKGKNKTKSEKGLRAMTRPDQQRIEWVNRRDMSVYQTASDDSNDAKNGTCKMLQAMLR
eukprot:scaffold224787_cov35-Prasinocladus_malaysianus.AAC.1